MDIYLFLYFLPVYVLLFSAKTPTKEDPVVDADGSINFAFDEYFDSADQPLPKTEIKEEKSQEILTFYSYFVKNHSVCQFAMLKGEYLAPIAPI